MKKILIIVLVLIAILVLVLVMKGRQGTPQAPSSQANGNTVAIDQFVAKAPADPAAPLLRRLSTALKAHPSPENTVVGNIAARSVQDGSVSSEDTVMLQAAVTLAEQDHVTAPELQAFSSQYQAAEAPPIPPAEKAQALAMIDTYLAKHPTGRGVTPLRRLSKALKSRPDQVQPLAATVVRRLEHGPISKADSTMLEEAATLAEKEGLSARDMAEFSRKYATGAGLSQKPQTAAMSEKKTSAPLANFDGKRQLIYTFAGGVQCTPTPCSNIRVRAHVTAGQWVESREDGVNGQGGYTLQMPVLSAVNEKVLWHVEANDKDLRKAELNGERVTTAADKDVTLQNSLVLTAH